MDLKGEGFLVGTNKFSDHWRDRREWSIKYFLLFIYSMRRLILHYSMELKSISFIDSWSYKSLFFTWASNKISLILNLFSCWRIAAGLSFIINWRSIQKMNTHDMIWMKWCWNPIYYIVLGILYFPHQIKAIATVNCFVHNVSITWP